MKGVQELQVRPQPVDILQIRHVVAERGEHLDVRFIDGLMGRR